MSPAHASILLCFETLALEAGRAIMDIFNGDFAVETKSDASPVTEADARAEAIILAGLRQAFPAIPCVAEEEASAGICPPDFDGLFFLVDPLDGTREFVNRNEDFTVNLALIHNGAPLTGVVYAPARRVFYGGSPEGAYVATVDEDRLSQRQTIRARGRPSVPTVLASRSHGTAETESYIASLGAVERVSIGSSLKFCLIAAGEADIYPRFGRTMEWDTAASDAILRAVGGATRCLDGSLLRYGKRKQDHDCDFANPHFIATGC